MGLEMTKPQWLGLVNSLFYKDILGRGERIRTSGLYVPNVALYRAKLHPDGRISLKQPGAAKRRDEWSG
jgi:hypothetical protein